MEWNLAAHTSRLEDIDRGVTGVEGVAKIATPPPFDKKRGKWGITIEVSRDFYIRICLRIKISPQTLQGLEMI